MLNIKIIQRLLLRGIGDAEWPWHIQSDHNLTTLPCFNIMTY